LLKKLYRILASRRRRRAFRKIRRGFARAGYPLDKFRDSQIEAALRHWNNDVSQVTVNAKTIHRTLKRLKGNHDKHVQRALLDYGPARPRKGEI
jgi:hypothetical protein